MEVGAGRYQPLYKKLIYLTCKFFSKKVTIFAIFVDKNQLFVCFSKKNAPKICIIERNSIPLPRI